MLHLLLSLALAGELDPQLLARGRPMAVAGALAEQEAQRLLLLDELGRPASVQPPFAGTSTPRSASDRELLRQELDALEALARENEGCLGAETRGDVQITLEQGRRMVNDPDEPLLQDMRIFVQLLHANVEDEIRACQGGR